MSKFDLVIDINTDALAKKITKHYEKRIMQGMKHAMRILFEELKLLTPERTREMLNSYEILNVIKVGGTYIGSVVNNASHGIYVEFGSSGKTFDYHKPAGVPFYSGVGNRTFARAMDNKRQEMVAIISQYISG